MGSWRHLTAQEVQMLKGFKEKAAAQKFRKLIIVVIKRASDFVLLALFNYSHY